MKLAATGVTGLATGCIDLDNQLTGFHAGGSLILAARAPASARRPSP